MLNHNGYPFFCPSGAPLKLQQHICFGPGWLSSARRLCLPFQQQRHARHPAPWRHGLKGT